MSAYPPKAEGRSTAVHDGPAAIIDELAEALEVILKNFGATPNNTLDDSPFGRGLAALAKARGEQ